MEQETTAPPSTPGARFLSRWAHRMERDGDCLVWTGPTTDGYGRVREEGWEQYVHRVAYRLLVGPIPEDRPLVLHSCPQRACFAVEHLYAGTPKDRGRALTERRRTERRAR